MQTETIKSYLYQQYQDDLDLQAFVDAFNQLSQGYVDWFNQVNIPIYAGLSGAFLDLIGEGLYGYPRPTIGSPSGAIYNFATYNQAIYSQGSLSSIIASDDMYKRILTWKLAKGDGKIMSLDWLKRRMMQFLLGENGVIQQIDSTYPISLSIGANNTINAVIDYPADQASVDFLVIFANAGVLDLPFQYPLNIVSA